VIAANGSERAVELRTGEARWLDAQEHRGSNVGASDSHALFIELKESRSDGAGPSTSSGHTSSSGHISAMRPALGPAAI
jgi:hypothetical protein